VLVRWQHSHRRRHFAEDVLYTRSNGRCVLGRSACTNEQTSTGRSAFLLLTLAASSPASTSGKQRTLCPGRAQLPDRQDVVPAIIVTYYSTDCSETLAWILRIHEARSSMWLVRTGVKSDPIWQCSRSCKLRIFIYWILKIDLLFSTSGSH